MTKVWFSDVAHFPSFSTVSARLGPSVMSDIRSLWDGAIVRKPYATSSIYEYPNKGPDGAPVGKFPAPHCEFPASGEQPHHVDLAMRVASRRAHAAWMYS
jgi:hypothetical protein